jgi:hypothetical protein
MPSPKDIVFYMRVPGAAPAASVNTQVFKRSEKQSGQAVNIGGTLQAGPIIKE